MENKTRNEWRVNLLVVLLWIGFGAGCTGVSGGDYNVNECVRLKASSNLGVPLHSQPGNVGVSTRLPDGTCAQIVNKNDADSWFLIKSGDVSGWITKTYIKEPVSCSGPEIPQNTKYVVGAWNIENFKDGQKRNFAGAHYGARTQKDYEAIASVIDSIDAKILILEEVGVETYDAKGEEEEEQEHSAALDRLVSILGPENYAYEVGSSGRNEHIAILYDKRCAKLESFCEMSLPKEKLPDKSQLFDKQPIFAHFRFFCGNKPMNDLTVVGIHLASGKEKTENHDLAVRRIVHELGKARSEGRCIPNSENDILIGGDFNTDRWDEHIETFWDELESNGWDVLANDPNTYPPTRPCAGSRLDYLIVTKGNKGLAGEEIPSNSQAVVHTEFIKNGVDAFRECCSDHLPVTIEVAVMPDND
jgi:endonuclease/exonuclease/phosphatase family metal-dependent hydrolase